MKLENLFLTKQELPLLNGTCFEIPVHPRLLRNDLQIDQNIAKRIFPKVAIEWYKDMQGFAKNTKDLGTMESYYKSLIQKGSIVKKEGNSQYYGGWEDHVLCEDNGLVTDFMISRDFGGSLYFNPDDYSCEGFAPSRLIKFSDEKAREFGHGRIKEFSLIKKYAAHNIDDFQGALFLRNWAIMYMNEVFKEIFKDRS